MTIEIVDLPIKNGGSFHSYVNVYQRVTLNQVQKIPGGIELHSRSDLSAKLSECAKLQGVALAQSVFSKSLSW